jgi:hypothetical protein
VGRRLGDNPDLTIEPVELSSGSADIDIMIDTRIWRWDEGAYIAHQPEDNFLLQPYKGYWVKSKVEGVYLVFPETAQAALSKPSSMFAAYKDRFIRYMKTMMPKAREAVAKDQDTPPMPMGALADNDNEDFLSGCFVEMLSQ